MRIKHFVLAGLVLALSGCQMIDQMMGIGTEQRTSSRLPANIPSAPPPDMPSPVKQQPAVTPAKVPSSLVIFVGSTTPIAGYSPVQQKGITMYVDPHQTLLFTDLSNALAVMGEDNRPYVSLTFSPAGAQKLASLTRNNIGKKLIVTLSNELINIVNIDGVNTHGILQVPMGSVAEAQNVERRILDGE